MVGKSSISRPKVEPQGAWRRRCRLEAEISMVMTDGDQMFCSNSADLLICDVFLLLKVVFVMYHFFWGVQFLSHGPFIWKLCHPEDPTDVIYLTDVLIVFGCWRLGAFPDGPGDVYNPWKADPRFNDSLCHTLGAVKPQGPKKGCVSHVFSDVSACMLAESANFHQTFLFHGVFQGQKKKPWETCHFLSLHNRFPVQFHEFFEGRLQMACEELN